jgi:hypothetical protein
MPKTFLPIRIHLNPSRKSINLSCPTNNPLCPAPETEVCHPILNANDKRKIDSNVQSVCLSTMVGSYLQHLLVFTLIFCYRDTTNVVVELLIKCTAIKPVSNCLIAEGLRLRRNSRSGDILLLKYLLLVLHRLLSLFYKLLPVATDIGISMDI